MNPYASRRQHLKLVRLPISPPPHWVNFTSIAKTKALRSDVCNEWLAAFACFQWDEPGAVILARIRVSASSLQYLQLRRMKSEV